MTSLQGRPRRHGTAGPGIVDIIGLMHRTIAVLLVLGVLLAGCSGPGGATATWSYGPSLEPEASGSAVPSGSAGPSASAAPSVSAAPSATAVASASAGASGPPGGAATTLTIGTRTGDELEFEPDEVSVPSGAQVELTFENLSALPHNLTFGEPINVATSPVVAPGASETIEFAAPAPGDYDFNCTIHPGMQGTLTVEAAR